jgi:transcriptional regulator with XRE-family HTH domain
MNVETANRLMQYRKKAGLSQEELADKLGVSRQAVSKWECAESSPDTDNLIALAKIYNISLDELINGEVEDNNKNNNKEKEGMNVHIHGEDGEVKVEGINIHIKDDDGSEVHIGKDGIHVKDANDEVNINGSGIHVKDEDGHYVKIRPTREKKPLVIESIISSSMALLVTIAYLLLGFLLPDGIGWRNYWVLFFLIPIIPSIFEAIRKRKFCVFAYPLAATMVFLSLGMFLGLWHPTWVIFITIPVYYSIFGPIDRAIREHQDKEYIIDNE